jgi:hypothetical protein
MGTRINSRAKGAKHEKEVAKLLEAWTGKEFARVPSSGGLRWHKTSNTTGDITCTTEGHYFPFSVEIKARNKVDFSRILIPYNGNSKAEKDKDSEFETFWQQAISDADRAKKEPILFVRYNGMKKDLYFVAITKDLFYDYFKQATSCTKYLVYGDKEFVVIPSTELFKANYKKIKAHIKTLRSHGKKK